MHRLVRQGATWSIGRPRVFTSVYTSPVNNHNRISLLNLSLRPPSAKGKPPPAPQPRRVMPAPRPKILAASTSSDFVNKSRSDSPVSKTMSAPSKRGLNNHTVQHVLPAKPSRYRKPALAKEPRRGRPDAHEEAATPSSPSHGGGEYMIPLIPDLEREKRVAAARFHSFEKAQDDAERRALAIPKLSRDTVIAALIGNSVIAAMKFGMYWKTGSSAMLSEAIHTLADSGNQMLLLKGITDSAKAPDKTHPYGYGRASFFWALVSAVGMFWTGAGISLGHGAYQLVHSSQAEPFIVSNDMLFVLGFSFAVDAYVLARTLREVKKNAGPNVTLLGHIFSQKGIRDPFVLAVLFEDSAACLGVILATTGIGLTHYTGDISYDVLASMAVGGLLAGVAVRLVAINRLFLVGSSVDEDTVKDIRTMLMKRKAFSSVHDVQTEWLGPAAFSFKAECDFDGPYIASQLAPVYAPKFREAASLTASPFEMDRVMALYAEDVTRQIEREIKNAEVAIRAKHPYAAFIELEPDSRKSYLRKADGMAFLPEAEEEETKRRRS